RKYIILNMLPRSRGNGYKILVIATSLLSITIILFGDRLLDLNPFFKNMVINLYLRQLLKALIALPFFLLCMEFGKRAGIIHLLQNIKNWWLNKPSPVFISLIFFAVVTVLIACFAYHQIPLGDAVWPFFQTKIFSRGRLVAPAPIDFRFFATPTIVLNGKWFSYTSPGHSLILLPFYLLGVSWLTGPLLGTIAIYFIYRLALEHTDGTTARIAILLAVTSPFMIFLFASHEFHVTSLFFIILAQYSLGKYRLKEGTAQVWALLAGLSLGMVFLTRPWTAIGVGIPLVLFAILNLRKGIWLFLLGSLIMVLLHLLYNFTLTGNCFTFPYQMMGKYHAIGFSPDYGAPTFNLAGHSALKLLINLIYNTFVLSLQLFGWLFFSLVFLIPGTLAIGFRNRWLIWAPGLGLICAYLFYWFHGITPWGPKYWSEALPAFIIVSAIGIKTLPDLLKKKASFGPNLCVRTVPFLILYCLTIYLPTHFTYFSTGRWGETPKVWQKVRSCNIHNAIVFVQTDERSGHFDYTSAFIFNDPMLKGDIIFPRDLGPENNRQFLRLFPDRSAYIYDYNNATLLPLNGHQF
ncbi:MAG: ArnT family glycosyltransferase, partial [bacterium]